MTTTNEIYISSPGETIQDLLDERNWNQKELAQRLGLSHKTVNQLITGKAALTEKTASKLVTVLGSTPTFWLNREANYRAKLAEQEQTKRLADWTGWLTKLPVKDLIKAGAIPALRLDPKNRPALVAALLKFFSVASPDQFEKSYGTLSPAFRRAKIAQSNRFAVVSWLRLGEIEAEKKTASKFSKPNFKQALKEIRNLTVNEPDVFSQKLVTLCRDAGVTLVFVPKIRKAHVAGVTRWLGPTRPMIQMSLYGGTNDHFWFTFFHEAAHVLFHKKREMIVDVSLDKVEAIEVEANTYARQTLIPDEYCDEFALLRTEPAIRSFAKKINLHPGIVLGRLQHDKHIDYATGLNRLKVSYQIVGASRN